MSKKIELFREEEIEISCSITPEVKQRGPDFNCAGGYPGEPSEIEDLYVGVIIAGISIDITKLLNVKQTNYIENLCFEAAEEDE